eukprot:gene38145-46351_t
MSKPQWAGEAELQGALQELCGVYPVPSSKIRQAVTVANKYCAEFKMVVYEIERFVKKAAAEDKIAGVFVMDSLCRQHSKERETFAKRFAVRLKDTTSFLLKVSAKDRSTFLRLLDEWQRKEVFPASSLQAVATLFGAQPFAEPGSSSRPADSAERAGDSAEPLGELAGRKRALEGGAARPALRLCPFRDGCPLAERCKFAHYEANALVQYLARLPVARDEAAPAEPQGGVAVALALALGDEKAQGLPMDALRRKETPSKALAGAVRCFQTPLALLPLAP